MRSGELSQGTVGLRAIRDLAGHRRAATEPLCGFGRTAPPPDGGNTDDERTHAVETGAEAPTGTALQTR